LGSDVVCSSNGPFSPQSSSLAPLPTAFITGIVCLAGYMFVIFAMYDGNLGDHCNRRYSPECNGVFKARSTCFMIMTIASLCLALEVMSRRRSFFRMRKKKDRHYTVTQPLRDLWQNKWLTWTIVLVFVVSLISLYIPGINKRLFKHVPIGKEWEVVLVLMSVWFGFVEGYKWCLRRYHKQRERKNGNVDYLELRPFRTWMNSESIELGDVGKEKE
jgi:P-type Na+/K+ transporter